jgi:hypothetical protein
VKTLGEGWENCENAHDEFVDGLGEPIYKIECKQRTDDGCRFLKEYVSRHSNINVTNNLSENMLKKITLSFRSYCDTLWNLPSKFDESPQHCQEWICHRNQYQCQTGQCIELDWLCDAEWDCPDASDEQAIDLNFQRLSHNINLPDFQKRTEKCRSQYIKQQPFTKKCNLTIEFPCFLANTTDPLHVEKNRPCINLTQIGDGIEDCYGGLDEKNTLESCDGSMLGFSFHCGNKQCSDYESLCQEKSESCRSKILCYYKSKNQSCSATMDVVCLDGSCKKSARCNGKFECSYGEDEHWCPLTETIEDTKYKYRNSKRSPKTYWKLFWPNFPLHSQPTLTEFDGKQATQYSRSLSKIINVTRIATSYADSYRCNRGVAIAYDSDADPVCFCPPSYYGDWCEYFSDRLTIITHLDLTSRTTADYAHRSQWYKVIASLLYDQRIIDFHEFHVNSNIEVKNFVKHKFYLLFSSTDQMREQKVSRYFNRTDIIENQPYSIRFDVYRLTGNEIDELGSWLYPIYFDFLPVFRLATVLKFPKWYENSTIDPCANNTSCPQNSVCRPIFNQEYPRFWCSCESTFYGKNCEIYEPMCLSYCSSDALCKPKGRGELTNTNNPLCICPLHRFGPRCNLRHEECNSKPCLNNGTCHLRHDPSNHRPFICICSKYYHGDYCEKSKFTIHISLNMSSYASASVVQFYDINFHNLQLLIQHQQVTSGLFTTIRYHHNKLLTPPLAILKLYSLSIKSEYYILYIQENATSIHITSTPKHCLHVTSLSFIQSKTH